MTRGESKRGGKRSRGNEMNPSRVDDTVSKVGVEIDRLSVATPQHVLLKETSVSLNAGETTLLVGASGSGKTVLLRLLSGLLTDGQTDIRVQGSIKFMSSKGHRVDSPAVGVVFQNLAIFDELSATQNVRFGADHQRCRQKDAAKKVEHLLSELEVPRETPTSLLSGGQRQRLAIARVLAQDPDLILYDEPTSGLDRPIARRVAQLIAATQKMHQKTCLIVTHDFDPLFPIADRILLLDVGSQQIREIPRGLAPIGRTSGGVRRSSTIFRQLRSSRVQDGAGLVDMGEFLRNHLSSGGGGQSDPRAFASLMEVSPLGLELPQVLRAVSGRTFRMGLYRVSGGDRWICRDLLYVPLHALCEIHRASFSWRTCWLRSVLRSTGYSFPFLRRS